MWEVCWVGILREHGQVGEPKDLEEAALPLNDIKTETKIFFVLYGPVQGLSDKELRCSSTQAY